MSFTPCNASICSMMSSIELVTTSMTLDSWDSNFIHKLRKTKGHGTKGGNSAKGSRPAGGFFGKVILTDPRLHQRTKRQLVNAPLSGYPLGTMPW